jgi:hypothetical protein
LYDYISQNKVYKYTETILVKFLTYYYLTLIAFFECSIIILGCFIELIVYLIRTKKIFLILIFFSIFFLVWCYPSNASVLYGANEFVPLGSMLIGPSTNFLFKFFMGFLEFAHSRLNNCYVYGRFIRSFKNDPILVFLALHKGIISFLLYVQLLGYIQPDPMHMDFFNSLIDVGPNVSFIRDWGDNVITYINRLIDISIREQIFKQDRLALSASYQQLLIEKR